MGPPDAGSTPRRWRRLDVLDARPVTLDGLIHDDPGSGLVAFPTEHDRSPSVRVEGGRIIELDGRIRDEFDLIDEFVADFGMDLTATAEAMAIDSLDAARMLVDASVPRLGIHRLAAGWTPAKLTEIVALLEPVELMMAARKMHLRRTPSIQAHVTNYMDDPALLAADAATAVALGFREMETTVPVLGHAASNALAILIGSQVGVPGAITQCSVEEATELELGLRGLTTYAETISLYGTEGAFVDGDDTPWSKAFLAAAYASRGIKMRVTTGAGAEALMGASEGASMAALEGRCVSLAWAMGAQGVQNGGIDGASVAGAVANGFRELLAENLMVMTRGLESCSGNDTLVSESDLRRVARTLPVLLAGADFLFSGFGVILRHDNMFGPSNFNGDDLDDYLAIQRDWGFDGVLRWPGEALIAERRTRAARAVAAVWRYLGIGIISGAQVDEAISAASSKDLTEREPNVVSLASASIMERGIGLLDVSRALLDTGFADEASALLRIADIKRSGDLLQPAAILSENLDVLSSVTDPNDYAGPGTGYRPTPERLVEMEQVRGAKQLSDLLTDQVAAEESMRLIDGSEPSIGADIGEVVIGISPAFGRQLNRTLSGLTVREALAEIIAGIEQTGAAWRVVRVRDTIDLGLIGSTAARLAGSGIGIGIQAKGTALIHQRDLHPLQNLELYSIAPLLTRTAYFDLGRNAGRWVEGAPTVPVQNPYTEAAITARYHMRVVAMQAVERDACAPGLRPVEVTVTHTDPSVADAPTGKPSRP